MKFSHRLVAAFASLAVLTACAGASTLYSAPPATQPGAVKTQPERIANARGAGKTGSTLYALNLNTGGSVYSVSVYGDAGATFLRSINLEGNNGAALAADNAGHVYAEGNSAYTGLLHIYASRGSKLVQTVQQPHVFGFLTLDTFGNLFTMCAADRVCEYAPGHQRVLKPLPIRKLAIGKFGVTAYALAVDGSGNLAVSGAVPGSGAVLVFAPGEREPYWTIDAPPGQYFGALIFDSSENLYVVTEDGVAVYAPGGTTPVRTITDGIVDPMAFAFDHSGNLFVLNYGDVQRGECSTPPSVSVYAPGGDTPIRTIIDGIVCADNHVIALDNSNRLYLANGGSVGTYDPGNIVVYPPGGTEPIRTVTQGIANPFFIGIGP